MSYFRALNHGAGLLRWSVRHHRLRAHALIALGQLPPRDQRRLAELLELVFAGLAPLGHAVGPGAVVTVILVLTEDLPPVQPDAGKVAFVERPLVLLGVVKDAQVTTLEDERAAVLVGAQPCGRVDRVVVAEVLQVRLQPCHAEPVDLLPMAVGFSDVLLLQVDRSSCLLTRVP